MGTSDTRLTWVTDSAAGLPQPGLSGGIDEDLWALQVAGVSLLVTLTTQSVVSAARLQRFDIEGLHFPIATLGVPDLEDCVVLCEQIACAISARRKVAFHCYAGLGRTGTMLACHLVWTGMDASSAIGRVRMAIPGAIETSEQAEFVHRLERRRAACVTTASEE